MLAMYLLISREGKKDIPGTIMVWQPMTKMTFIGPNSLTFSFLRSLMAKPNLTTKMVQKKQMLMVMTMVVALSSHWKGS